jgi:cytochrome c oxidase subunit 2
MFVLMMLIGVFGAAGEAQEKPCDPAGRALYYPCSSCHGLAGEGNEAFAAPALAGLSTDYLTRQLSQFQAGTRGSHPDDAAGQQMTLLARTLRDGASLEAVACHVAAMPLPPRPAATIKGNARRGKVRYGACAACHGERALGNPELGAPAIAQLADWYLRSQLRAYRDGWRGRQGDDPYGVQMAAAVAVLPDDRAIADVAAYVATLR